MRHYSLIFNTTAGGRRSFRVNNPNTDLPIEDIKAAVDQILANDVFDPASERGGLDSLGRLNLTIVERTQIV